MRFGQDNSVVFVRNAESIDREFPEHKVIDLICPKFGINQKIKKNTTMTFIPVVVVFCGKTYRGMKCRRTTKLSVVQVPSYGVETEVKVFYNYKEMEEYLALYEMKMPEEKRYYWQTDYTNEKLKTFLDSQGTSELSEYCITNRFVTLTLNVGFDVYDPSNSRRFWTANGQLSDTQFYKIFDPYMAYQELDMFISGTLPQSTAMPIQIEDKYRIAQHGFDKHSFRKPKQK